MKFRWGRSLVQLVRRIMHVIVMNSIMMIFRKIAKIVMVLVESQATTRRVNVRQARMIESTLTSGILRPTTGNTQPDILVNSTMDGISVGSTTQECNLI